ncbi:MAG: cation:proton antiporter subunit C [Deltaproteobacteria bacterium]|nr:cation:proton antiporter subunit C [Deltaproteobacteria bacterium]
MADVFSFIVANYNFWVYIALMMIGLWGMIAKTNLVKKIVGMSIFQTAIILFYVSLGAKKGAGIPIIMHGHGGPEAINVADYINPLPHVLMLTAIVVSVATLGVALALGIKLYQRYQTLQEDEILEQIRNEEP